MLRPTLLALSVLAPIGALGLPSTAAPPGVGQRLADAANAFLESLDDAGRGAAILPFDDDERRNWQFVPGAYPGVLLADLDLDARRKALRLLREALGTQGTLKTLAILRLETVLRVQAEAADARADHRDPERYALAIFGAPSTDAPWGLRFQGHHVSLNLTIVDGALVTATPRFFGANPHELREGPQAGQRVLAAEEDLARNLLASLTDEQRSVAVVAGEVPPDILLGPGREADLLGEPTGIGWAALNEVQRGLLVELTSSYLTDLAPDIGRQELLRLRAPGYDGLHFAWIGSSERGEPHYYRVHGPTFVLEYDNVQDGANHSHTVWHDLRSSFGGDLLRAHYDAAHRRR